MFERKIVNIFLPISFNICLGAQKNCLIETVLLSTHNFVLVEKLENYFMVRRPGTLTEISFCQAGPVSASFCSERRIYSTTTRVA